MDGYEKLKRCTNRENQIKFSKCKKQYQYSEDNQEYLDLVSQVALVGHSHPVILLAGQRQIERLSSGQSFKSPLQQKFNSVIMSLLPLSLKCYYMVNSGSEANDLAMSMAKKYTGGHHFIVFKGAYHGSFTGLLDVSPKVWSIFNWSKTDLVHVVNPPDMYRGPYGNSASNDACDQYVKEVSDAIASIKKKGGKLAAFLSEPIATSCGVIIPPKNYYKKVYNLIRKAGGICIADETGCNLGRAGGNLWTFEHFDVIPDIVTVGKSIGNGYPVSLVSTTKDISNMLGQHFSTFGGNPVACSVSTAVLDVIDGEMLRTSACCVGKNLLEELNTFKSQHSFIGDVRGLGLCIGLEIVHDSESKKPHPKLAAHISERLSDNNCLVGICGIEDNVLILTPPLCMTLSNVRQLSEAFANVLPRIMVEDFDIQSNSYGNARKKCKYTATKNSVNI